jgi:hypothetical protein
MLVVLNLCLLLAVLLRQVQPIQPIQQKQQKRKKKHPLLFPGHIAMFTDWCGLNGLELR